MQFVFNENHRYTGDVKNRGDRPLLQTPNDNFHFVARAYKKAGFKYEEIESAPESSSTTEKMFVVDLPLAGRISMMDSQNEYYENIKASLHTVY